MHNRLDITVKDLDMVGEVIDTIGAGANQVQSVSFDIQDKQAMQIQALRTLLRKLDERGSPGSGRRSHFRGIKVITEQNTSYIPYTDTAALRSFAVAEAKTQITPGDVEVSAEVYVEFWF